MRPVKIKLWLGEVYEDDFSTDGTFHMWNKDGMAVIELSSGECFMTPPHTIMFTFPPPPQ